jgi:pimeloyl-ACP methyl ester carboxylesterase
MATAVVADVTTQPTIPDMARDLLARHPGRLILAGHSMGGRVAMEMARMAPGRIAGMALLNTGMHPCAMAKRPSVRCGSTLPMRRAWPRWPPLAARDDGARTPDPALIGPV